MPPRKGKMMFHILTKGECWLRLANHEDIHLTSGDIALLPRGEGHQIVEIQVSPLTQSISPPEIRTNNHFTNIGN